MSFFKKLWVLLILVSYFLCVSSYAAPLYELLWQSIITEYSYQKTEDRMTCQLINFRQLKTSQSFSTILRFLNKYDYQNLNDKSDKIAFWINVYNICATKIILENYPIQSIDELNNRYGDYKHIKQIQVSGESFSLSDIENKLLMFSDSRILFALYNGTLSGPQLYKAPFTSSQLNSQLDMVQKQFINERYRGVDIQPGTRYLYVSRLFSNYSQFFPNQEKVKDYLQKFLAEDISDYNVFYFINNNKINDY